MLCLCECRDARQPRLRVIMILRSRHCFIAQLVPRLPKTPLDPEVSTENRALNFCARMSGCIVDFRARRLSL